MWSLNLNRLGALRPISPALAVGVASALPGAALRSHSVKKAAVAARVFKKTSIAAACYSAEVLKITINLNTLMLVSSIALRLSKL